MNLLIVESPSKAKTLEKYLGRDWKVVASVGHVRDLVKKDGSIDTTNNFAPHWQIIPGKEKNIKQITDAVSRADNIYLASDPDREGEGIAWHILEILTHKKALSGKNIYRVTFNEITKKAVLDAIANPREIDQNLVDAYLVRMSLDYLIGFGVSPLLWRRNLGKSAGRVQSVAVKLVVDREREIEAFNPVEYWSLDAVCIKRQETRDKGQEFIARLTQFNGEKIDKMSIGTKEQVDNIISQLSNLNSQISATVSDTEKKKVSRKPAPPFTTSTLQQEAARKLHFSSKRTMSTAQKLYEQGFITYMRTDATNLSADAVANIRAHIGTEYGDAFLPKSPNIYVTKSKNAQEAHEAVRPTEIGRQSSVVGLDGDELKLYDLIWKRTVACQMTNAEFDQVSVDIETIDKRQVASATFHAVGTTRTFDGFMKVYIEDRDDQSDDAESKLPLLNIGDEINITELIPEQHFTQPPARFTEASLVKKLEELGIGRPSTYASIMSTIVDRNYVEQDKSRRFHPTDGGWVIASYLNKYFSDLVDVNFTAKTEDMLDDVANGGVKKIPALESFWLPQSKKIDAARDVKTTEIIDELNNSMEKHLFKNCTNVCPKCGGKLGLKLSRFGAFIGCDNYPTCDYTQRLDTKSDGTIHEDDCAVNRPINIALGDGIEFKVGKYGPYVTDGNKNASAKKYTGETITLEIARELLAADKKKAEAIELGINPTTNKPVLYYATGRFGAYISSNKVNVSVKEQPTLEKAIELINNKKKK